MNSQPNVPVDIQGDHASINESDAMWMSLATLDAATNPPSYPLVTTNSDKWRDESAKGGIITDMLNLEKRWKDPRRRDF